MERSHSHSPWPPRKRSNSWKQPIASTSFFSTREWESSHVGYCRRPMLCYAGYAMPGPKLAMHLQFLKLSKWKKSRSASSASGHVEEEYLPDILVLQSFSWKPLKTMWNTKKEPRALQYQHQSMSISTWSSGSTLKKCSQSAVQFRSVFLSMSRCFTGPQNSKG